MPPDHLDAVYQVEVFGDLLEPNFLTTLLLDNRNAVFKLVGLIQMFTLTGLRPREDRAERVGGDGKCEN